MFASILIANRGEIAVRIMATCRRLGVSTVAVYSDADRDAMHVASADRALRIGPPPASESYLNADAIIAAARDAGAEAIHPGYGFLSESPDFADAVADAGLVFIGPPAAAIRAMGRKDAAKALMEKAGVPVVPGYHEADQDDARLLQAAEEIGTPLLIKAIAGGGGKGMRRVDDLRAFPAALKAARGEAAAAFGNSAVLLERFVTAPRHVEIQVFGDSLGNVVHLFERDCSLQRRHQKVIEEAPAPGMTDEMRAVMGEAAVAAARSIGYVGAGTVEFILDGSEGLRPDRFWFMEMNTRLQVEHPVTEAITGEDLVAWQLRVAAGEPLPKSQDALTITGHAMEARLYAEDAARGFLPAIGVLSDLRFPEGIRVDAGVGVGDAITPYYDPMIAKMITHAPTRDAARGRLAGALDRTRIAGCTSNLGFLARLLRNEEFAAERVDTALIGRHMATLAAPPAASDLVRALAGLAASDLLACDQPLAGFTLWSPLVRQVRLIEADQEVVLRIEVLGPRRFRVDGRSIVLAALRDREATVETDGRRQTFGVAKEKATVTVFDAANAHSFGIIDPLAERGDAEAGGNDIRAPMPGLVKALNVEIGAAVARGDVLLVLEAMKMEHALTSPRDGTVARIEVRAGAQVTDGTLLLSLDGGDG